jgi:hypothetical protein
MKKIRKMFKRIMMIKNNNMQLLYKYALFLKKVFHDELECEMIIEKMNLLREQENVKRHHNMRFTGMFSSIAEGRSIMIRASGEKTCLSKILDINFETCCILHFNKKDLMGVSANLLMPPLIANLHDEWMLRHFETLQQRHLGNINNDFLKTKEGYFISTYAFNFLVPNLRNGIQFIYFAYPDKPNRIFPVPSNISALERPVFLKKKIFNEYLQIAVFLCNTNWKIEGLSVECNTYFNFTPSISKTEYSLGI